MVWAETWGVEEDWEDANGDASEDACDPGASASFIAQSSLSVWYVWLLSWWLLKKV